MQTTKKTAGFTLIELLIVVVIIGILATIAIPKFAATKDKAKLSAIRSDIRNVMTAQEAYWADFGTYASLAQLQSATNYTFSGANNAIIVSPTATGYTTTVSNSTIASGIDECTVQVGAGAASTIDGIIICS
ncbi:MAG: prepilin-type N-terminal cleavage/methylation domain-containing protein [Gemmatimonadetes bacterium]|nr:prepilin-type N-terminal cleavage/methylation domain-containing protein [Gemmatimonadota bacterium]